MPDEQAAMMDPEYIIADLNARVRSLENKYNTLTERLLVVNQNMMEEYKKMMSELRNLKRDSKKMSLDVSGTHDVIKDIVKEMQIFAKKDQMKILEKYVGMINILKFVTNEELDERIGELKGELSNAA